RPRCERGFDELAYVGLKRVDRSRRRYGLVLDRGKVRLVELDHLDVIIRCGDGLGDGLRLHDRNRLGRGARPPQIGVVARKFGPHPSALPKPHEMAKISADSVHGGITHSRPVSKTAGFGPRSSRKMTS